MIDSGFEAAAMTFDHHMFVGSVCGAKGSCIRCREHILYSHRNARSEA